jgi:hypothetical protein
VINGKRRFGLKRIGVILFFFACTTVCAYCQGEPGPLPIAADSTLNHEITNQAANDSLTVGNDSLLMPGDSIAPDAVPADSLHIPAPDSTARMSRMDSIRTAWKNTFAYVDASPFRDSLRIYYWRISENLGEFRPAQPDTAVTGFYNRNYVDGLGTSIAYPGNPGTPAISRIFSEREPASGFMFADAYSLYNREPGKFNFINARVPYSKLEYQSEGSGDTQNERLRGGISVNLNRKLNFGFDIDFLYARGRYNYQGAKHVDFVFYSSYFSDRYRYHFFYNNRSYINEENGGIADDRFITSPEAISENQTQNMRSKDIPTRIHDTWNRVKGSRFFYTHRYNIGFETETDKVDEEGNDITQFVTVASIIHTADLRTQQHKFISNDNGLDTIYTRAPYPNTVPYLNMATNDTTRTFNFKNTLGLSMREGFSRWAKFDLTAYASLDYRQYLLMERLPATWLATQTSAFVGGELAKTTGKILRYNAHAEFGVLGENLGDVDVSGTVETYIPVFRDTASLKARAYLKNITPGFYEKHYHSKYFWWDNDFSQTQRVYAGGELNIPHTRSRIGFGVENVTNHIYFDEAARPRQHSDNIQILTARLDQNFKAGVLHWDNEAVYQKTSDANIIPLPDWCLYSNLYLSFRAIKVLQLQLGVDVHYFTKYYSPAYEPATQQFHLQRNTETGNYPLMNAYVNGKLHQVRFFINFYNVGTSFMNGGAYFSLPHYPVSPMLMKFGLSIDLNN